jgi:hypothetical protein
VLQEQAEAEAIRKQVTDAKRRAAAAARDSLEAVEDLPVDSRIGRISSVMR